MPKSLKAVLLLLPWFLLAVVLVRHALISVRLSYAIDQVEIIQEQRQSALNSQTPSTQAGCLKNILHYYPSGTKQPKGSKLDKLVENVREASIHEIIDALKKSTGKDLGNDPEKWISEYATP